MDSLSLLQQIFPTQELIRGLLHWRRILFQLSYQRSPVFTAEDKCMGNIFKANYNKYIASLVAQRVRHLPAVQETWVQSLGQEDPLEKELATHSSTLAWKIPCTEEPCRIQSMGLQRVGHDLSFTFFTFTLPSWRIFVSHTNWKRNLHVKFLPCKISIQSMEFSRPEYWSG